MTRAATTEQTWPTETPEELIERVRREHGDSIADIVAADIASTDNRRRRPPKKVIGSRPKPAPAWTQYPGFSGRSRTEVLEEAKARFGARIHEPWVERILLCRTRHWSCSSCGVHITSGSECGLLTNGRRVCTGCVPQFRRRAHAPP